MTKTKNKIRSIDKKEPKKTMLKNFMFELLAARTDFETSLARLKLQYTGLDMLKINQFIAGITGSRQFIGYVETRTKILNDFNEKQKKLPEKERRPPMSSNIPEWQEILEADSGLEIEKHKLDVSKMPDWKDPERMFNGHDMDALSCFFEYVGEE